MQNRYTGDIGDFSKLGLLRVLDRSNLSIGINWYLVPDEDHNSDGKFTKYLDPGQDQYRECDEELWQELSKIVQEKRRTVSALQNDRILHAVHYAEILDFRGKKKAERDSLRTKWHAQALETLSGINIIFTDPDNGLIVPSAEGTPRENKYVLLEELRDYYHNGSSVIYYQHKARKKDPFYIDQHERILKDPAFCDASGMLLKFTPSSQRYYCFIMQPEHERLIRKAVDQMLDTAWKHYFCLK